MIPAWAKVGAKVVAIRDGSKGQVKKGDVFTIRELLSKWTVCVSHPEFSGYGMRVTGILERHEGDWLPIAAFRPVQTKTQEQDIEMFAPLLNTKDEKELIDG
ncbi:hypothetical protein [Maritalea porphyrae]|uniref:hypothetical protein n=1 Tax=Maritalea porphyrae TaxID=880732 RepID=UPI0022B03865|nr:hypothetical protein [Maritalea porphyrae]MCZ4270909.1 hypothetical protein [Maritalea porphyrae]